MEENYAKNRMTKASFIEKRRELFDDEDWEEYEKLMRWHYQNSEKAYNESLEIVAQAIGLESKAVSDSANFHGQSITSLGTITSSLRSQEKGKKPKISKQEALEH